MKDIKGREIRCPRCTWIARQVYQPRHKRIICGHCGKTYPATGDRIPLTAARVTGKHK